MKNILLILIFLTSLSVQAKKKPQPIQEYQGQVQSCHDGDTCRVLVEGKVMKIRFSGIDCPEKKQNKGMDALRFTEQQILNKNVNLQCEGKSYDRQTCTVFLDNENINEKIVRQGWAWDSKRYSKGKYAQAQELAKSEQLGIWQDVKQSPFCYRHKSAKKCRVSQLYME